ncbi:hypothetical protein F2Q69_00029130 [Brassica cretica]|uniref:Uncharacterized protein n=1 Tax=Brassica cretica TaxID=69181 RepID=A0A8S9SBN5_BRACR|nr:hypothetical protein F2Q69_00029130 [Brassica cretica]
MIVIIPLVFRPSASFILRLVSLRGFFSGRISVRLWRAIGIEDEIFNVGYFRELSNENLCGHPCSQDFAVSRGVSSGLVELAEGVFVISLIASPRITRGSGMVRIDRPALPARSNRGFPPLLSLVCRTESFPEPIVFMSVDVLIGVIGDIARIQVNAFDFVILRILCGRWRTFGVPLFDGRFLDRVLTQRSFSSNSRSIEWGSEVESFPRTLVVPRGWIARVLAVKPALPARSNRGFPPLLSLVCRTESFPEPIVFMSVDVLIGVIGDIARIQVNAFDFVILRILCGRWRTFGVPLFDGRFLDRVLTQRSFSSNSRSIEWGSEVESFPRTLVVPRGWIARVLAVKVGNIFLNSSSAAALAGALAADTSAAGVWRSVPLPPLIGVFTLSASLVDMSD